MVTRVRMRLVRTETNGGLEGLRSLLKDRAVKVGVLRGTGAHPNSKEGYSVAQILAFNEFGTATTPERSVIRYTLRNSSRKYRQTLTRLFRKVLNGTIRDRAAIGAFGELVQRDMQQRIVNVRTPPNAPSTIKRKNGKTNPLIDTGTMRQSIRWGLVNASTLRTRITRR